MPRKQNKASDIFGWLSVAVGVLLVAAGFVYYVLVEGDGGSAPPPMAETIKARQVAYFLFALGAAIGVGGPFTLVLFQWTKNR